MFKINDDSQEAAALADFSNIDKKSKKEKDSKVLPYGKIGEQESESKIVDFSTPNSIQKMIKPQIYSESELMESPEKKLNLK